MSYLKFYQRLNEAVETFPKGGDEFLLDQLLDLLDLAYDELSVDEKDKLEQ